MKVSIITVSFNSESTIAETINSVNNQNYKDIEHIFIDGSSTDQTVKIIRNTSNRKSILVSEPDEGIYNAMNKGIKLATGDIIGILNSDDTFTDASVVGRIVRLFEMNNDYVYSGINYVNHLGVIKRKWPARKFKKGDYFYGWHTGHPGFWVNRKLYQETGFFREELTIAADFEFMLRIMEFNNYQGAKLAYFTVNMKLGGESNASVKNILKGNRDVLKAFKVNGKKAPLLYPFFRLLPKLKQFI
jgi:glycosyltransferase involved in cell wall biosynthesis